MNQQENRLTKPLPGVPRRRRGSTSSQREGSKHPQTSSNAQPTRNINHAVKEPPANQTVRESELNHAVLEAPFNHSIRETPVNRIVMEAQRTPQRLSELEEALANEKKSRQEVEKSLQDSEAQHREYLQRWKESSSELNRYLSRGQGFLIVEDKTLVELTNQLRMKVRDLIINRLKKPTSIDAEPLISEMGHALGVTAPCIAAFVSSSDDRCMIMQAFIWRILQADLLGCFCWAPEMLGIVDRLEPKISPAAVEYPEAKRRFQVWKATTSTLVYDSFGETYLQSESVWQLSRAITSKITPLTHSKKTVLNEVYSIVRDAIKLDMTLQRQASEMIWFEPRSAGAFNEATMKLESGDLRNAQGGRVSLVVAPALYRRGTSNGDDFRQEELLVPMLVTCDPMEYQPRSEQLRISKVHRVFKDSWISFWKGSR